jgi:hypothetical protein
MSLWEAHESSFSIMLFRRSFKFIRPVEGFVWHKRAMERYGAARTGRGAQKKGRLLQSIGAPNGEIVRSPSHAVGYAGPRRVMRQAGRSSESAFWDGKK